jgi:hypothetical protein
MYAIDVVAVVQCCYRTLARKKGMATLSAKCCAKRRTQSRAHVGTPYYVMITVVSMVFMNIVSLPPLSANHLSPESCRREYAVPSNLNVSRPDWLFNGHHVWPRAWRGVPRPNSNYTGQDMEDRYLYEHFFYGVVGGSYLEIGGFDGYKFSNTFWLHQQLGWRGMLIL